MKTKHTENYAKELALIEFPEKAYGSNDLEIAIENSKIGFVKGYMQAIKETNAPELLETLMEVYENDGKCNSALFKKVHNVIKKATE